MLVEIKPIERQGWHGHKNIGRNNNFTPLCATDRMEYAVKLSPKEIEEYSKKVGKDLSLSYYPGQEHEFWDSKLALVELKNTTVVYDTDRPLDFLKHRICLGSNDVADSLEDYNNGLFPGATHYIYSEEEETKVKASKVSVRNAARKLMFSATRNEKNMVALLVGGVHSKSSSDDALEVLLEELIEEKPTEVTLKFQELKGDKVKVSTQYMVQEAIYFSILLNKKGGIYYFETLVGRDVEEATDFFMKDKNQAFKIQIIGNLKNKK